jgi:hypothetical protein
MKKAFSSTLFRNIRTKLRVLRKSSIINCRKETIRCASLGEKRPRFHDDLGGCVLGGHGEQLDHQHAHGTRLERGQRHPMARLCGCLVLVLLSLSFISTLYLPMSVATSHGGISSTVRINARIKLVEELGLETYCQWMMFEGAEATCYSRCEVRWCSEHCHIR